MSAASWNKEGLLGEGCSEGWGIGGAPDDRDDPTGQSLGPIELVGGEDDGGALRHGPPDEAVEDVATLVVEPGVRLVVVPQLGRPREQAGE
jgi:hypothetical protein